MAQLILSHVDHVLDKMNEELVDQFDNNPRTHLGASSIGDECDRKIWSGFHWVGGKKFDANGIKATEDGKHSEIVMATRLKLVKNIQLQITEPNGKQLHFKAGHFGGSLDGVILGAGYEKKKMHVWEHKCCNVEKFNKLHKLKMEVGEFEALEKWDIVYFAQAQTYMHKFNIEHHYLTVSTPGTRSEQSCVTNYNPDAGEYYGEKRPRDIIKADRAPSRISMDPAWYKCKFCGFHENCHGSKLPDVNCRTCIHSTPETEGQWTCALHHTQLDEETQRMGCAAHLFNPSIVPGQQLDAGEGWVDYKTPDGKVIRNTGAQVIDK